MPLSTDIRLGIRQHLLSMPSALDANQYSWENVKFTPPSLPSNLIDCDARLLVWINEKMIPISTQQESLCEKIRTGQTYFTIHWPYGLSVNEMESLADQIEMHFCDVCIKYQCAANEPERSILITNVTRQQIRETHPYVSLPVILSWEVRFKCC